MSVFGWSSSWRDRVGLKTGPGWREGCREGCRSPGLTQQVVVEREPGSQPLKIHPRTPQLGHSHLPPLKSTEASSTKATHLRGETAWHQPGSKPAQRGHLDPRKDLPSCHGWGKGGGAAGESSPGWGQVGMCSLGQGRGKVAAPSCTSPPDQHHWRKEGLPGSPRFEKGEGETAGTQGRRWEHQHLPERSVGSRSSHMSPSGGFSPCLPPTMALQTQSLPLLPFQKENFTEIREGKAPCPKSCLSTQ